jgi:hypothetical protein
MHVNNRRIEIWDEKGVDPLWLVIGHLCDDAQVRPTSLDWLQGECYDESV